MPPPALPPAALPPPALPPPALPPPKMQNCAVFARAPTGAVQAAGAGSFSSGGRESTLPYASKKERIVTTVDVTRDTTFYVNVLTNIMLNGSFDHTNENRTARMSDSTQRPTGALTAMTCLAP